MIELVRIQNFKSIRSLELELKPVNILIGANGAGKSNFISFFKLLNRLSEGRLRDYVAENEMENLLCFGKKHSEFIEGFVDFAHQYAYKFRLVPQNGQGAYLNESVLTTPSVGEADNYTSWNSWEAAHLNESVLPDEKNNASVKSALHYLQSIKIYHFHDTSKSSRMKSSSFINDNVVLREDGANLAAVLYLMQERHITHFRRIEAAVKAIAPFFDRFVLKPKALNPEKIELEWSEKENDAYRNVHHFSDGTLRFIALAVLLLQPNLPHTILIDEPELGLHPSAINHLAGLIRKAVMNGTQVIVSTQSVNLVNNFEPEDILIVEREGIYTTFERLKSEPLKSWLDGYNYSLGDIWEKNIIGANP